LFPFKAWPEQGDQIGRIFAHWAIAFVGQFIENYRSSANSWANFFPSTSCVLILTKNCLCYTLGDFFKNSSGHPGPKLSRLVTKKIFNILSNALA
jgi:hypothetical protein